VTPGRAEEVHYTLPLSDSEMAIYVQRTGRSVISIGNHLNEFDTLVWILAFLTFVILVVLDIFMTNRATPEATFSTVFSSTMASVTRAMASKAGGQYPPKRGASHRILALTAGLFGVFIFAAYCGFLNGYLTVLIPAYKVRNVEDIYEHSNGLVQWEGSFILSELASYSEGHVRRRIYDKWLEDEDAKLSTDWRDGFEKVAKRNYALIKARHISRMELRGSDLECQVMEVPNHSARIISIALAFSRQHEELAKAFNREIMRMRQSGELTHISSRYMPDDGSKGRCNDDDVQPLGYSNLYVPVFILSVGFGASLVLSLLEAVFKRIGTSFNVLLV